MILVWRKNGKHTHIASRLANIERTLRVEPQEIPEKFATAARKTPRVFVDGSNAGCSGKGSQGNWGSKGGLQFPQRYGILVNAINGSLTKPDQKIPTTEFHTYADQMDPWLQSIMRNYLRLNQKECKQKLADSRYGLVFFPKSQKIWKQSLEQIFPRKSWCRQSMTYPTTAAWVKMDFLQFFSWNIGIWLKTHYVQHFRK